MFIEPRIKVNPVIDQTAAESDVRHTQLNEQRGTDSQILGGLLLREAPNRRQRQDRLIHHKPCCARLPGVNYPELSATTIVSGAVGG
jgi:hypothetical protein